MQMHQACADLERDMRGQRPGGAVDRQLAKAARRGHRQGTGLWHSPEYWVRMHGFPLVLAAGLPIPHKGTSPEEEEYCD